MSFRENSNGITLIKRFGDKCQSLLSAPARNRNSIEKGKKRLEVPYFIIAALHHKSYLLRVSNLQNRPVEERDMVAKQQHPFFRIDVVKPLYLNTVAYTDNDTNKITYHRLRQLHHSGQCPYEGNSCNEIEKPRRRELEVAKECSKNQCTEHYHILYKVIPRKHHPQNRCRRCELNERIERYDNKAGEEPKREERYSQRGDTLK